MSTTTFTDTVELLRWVYDDLVRVGEVGADDFVLHRADGSAALHGLDAAVAHEAALIAATGNTLVMDVRGIAADEHFGAVLGTLRADAPEPIAMPFCGLWRFAHGRAVEHWENAYDAADLGRRLAGGAR